MSLRNDSLVLENADLQHRIKVLEARLADKNDALWELAEFFAESFTFELLEKIGAEKCVEHFDLKLVVEKDWKEDRDL